MAQISPKPPATLIKSASSSAFVPMELFKMPLKRTALHCAPQKLDQNKVATGEIRAKKSPPGNRGWGPVSWGGSKGNAREGCKKEGPR